MPELIRIRRAQLEYPTVDVSIPYLIAIGKFDVYYATEWYVDAIIASNDVFVDKAVETIITGHGSWLPLRIRSDGEFVWYEISPRLTTQDSVIFRREPGKSTLLAAESIDLPIGYAKIAKFSVSGSTYKAFREDLSKPKLSVTDTTYPDGHVGLAYAWIAGKDAAGMFGLVGWLRAPASPGLRARAIIEAEVCEDSGVIYPRLSSELVDVERLDIVPEFLRLETKKYLLLKRKGFSDEEIEVLFGRIPQHRVDIAAVTWGAFDHKHQHSTMLIIVTGDNPYREGAVDKQIEYAKARGLKVVRPPRDYWGAVEQYRALKRDFPEWIAGKDNYAYQTLGHEVLELFQVADTYYGNIVEGIKPDTYKNVPDWEMRRTLSMWINRLKKVDVLTEERDKHIRKLEKVLKIGW